MTELTYKNIIDDFSDGVFQVNADGYFTYVNKVITERYGIPLEKFRTLHFLDIVDPRYQDFVKVNFRRVMGGEHGIMHEIEHKDADGQVRFLELRSSPMREGERVVGLMGISRDVTGRKRMEKALQESEKKYRLVVENAQEAIVVTQDLRLVFVNHAAVSLTGYSQEILTSRPVTEFIHPDDRNMVMEKHIKRLKGEKVPSIYSYRVISRMEASCGPKLILFLFNGMEDPPSSIS